MSTDEFAEILDDIMGGCRQITIDQSEFEEWMEPAEVKRHLAALKARGKIILWAADHESCFVVR